MNTTVDELKVLYTELGGSAEDVENISTIPDMIAALANVAGSTIELPAVSASDNGDVLEVVNGKWAKVATAKLPATTASDEGSALIVNSSGAWDKGAIPAELPAVTAADNGKVLGVTAGAWGKVDADVMIVKCSTTQILDEVTTTDANVTFTDFASLSDACQAINTAVRAKKYVILALSGGTTAQTLGTITLFLPIVGEVAPNMNLMKFETLHYSNVASKLLRYVVDTHTYMGSSAKLTIAAMS